MGLELRIIVIGLLFFIISGASVAITVGVYNVKDYGAAGDGQTDNTKAFVAAWSVACAVQGKATIVIPEGAYLLGPTIFKGPCNGIMVMQVVEDLTDKELLHGLITNAKRHRIANPYPCFVMNAAIKSISSIDNMFFHIHIFGSRNITFDSIKISAPGDSPNTDGIHIANSANIQVSNSVIGTGDDCISIGPGCTNLTIFRVLCGPGHGISIGSLGKNAGEKDVIGLYVSKCNLTGTTNGLRIKTLQSSPSTLKASHFRFEQIIMNNVYNPIIIDQNYCPSANCPKRYTSLLLLQLHISS
ncbi:Glycosyl hydrolases family 28 [Musa troglodytarum]|uniref:Glycosyl hydrolases family 28 n=1 Tax=Musa troglodytarum TaxID=320322 RepID=A0A9E7HF51_9LILI|nr:Glycosyl hydrolases family 28 [Musa troglodytarum]